MLARFSLLAVLALTLAACGVGRHVQKGINAYTIGNYQGAMLVWSDLAARESEMNEKGRVRYLVYRGLTHYRLGQQRQALTYLSLGSSAYRAGNPKWLPPRDVQEMQAALGLLQSGAPADAAPPPPLPPGAAPSPAVAPPPAMPAPPPQEIE